MQNLILQIKNRVVFYLYHRFFKSYVRPFVSADEKIAVMTDIKRNEYFREWYEIMQGDGIRIEFDEAERHFRDSMCNNILSTAEQLSIINTLNFIKYMQDRFIYLANQHVISQSYDQPT